MFHCGGSPCRPGEQLAQISVWDDAGSICAPSRLTQVASRRASRRSGRPRSAQLLRPSAAVCPLQEKSRRSTRPLGGRSRNHRRIPQERRRGSAFPLRGDPAPTLPAILTDQRSFLSKRRPWPPASNRRRGGCRPGATCLERFFLRARAPAPSAGETVRPLHVNCGDKARRPTRNRRRRPLALRRRGGNPERRR